MRSLLLAAALIGLTGCGLGNSTAPKGTVITVHLIDDSGAPAGRNQVMVSIPGSEPVRVGTRNDGTIDINVPDAGVYKVRIIPRASFVTSDSLTKDVAVEANARTVVSFMLYRGGGWTPIDPHDYPYDPYDRRNSRQ